MKNTALAVFVILLFTFGMAASYASAIYQDDFQVNDYTLRYTTWNAWKDGWWPNDFTYVDLGGGSTGFAPSGGWWSSAIDTKDYLNGHFTNTSYTASVALKCVDIPDGPSLSFSLLNNGFVGSSLNHYGYTAAWAKTGVAVILMLGRVNSDGSYTGFFDNWSAPFISADQTKWSNLIATVDVGATETYLKLKWDGVDGSGNPSSYSIDYHDTSAQRWTTGTGIGIKGFCGNGNPSSSGVVLDNLQVTTLPEPSSFVAFACGLVSLIGIRRRRA